MPLIHHSWLTYIVRDSRTQFVLLIHTSWLTYIVRDSHTSFVTHIHSSIRRTCIFCDSYLYNWRAYIGDNTYRALQGWRGLPGTGNARCRLWWPVQYMNASRGMYKSHQVCVPTMCLTAHRHTDTDTDTDDTDTDTDTDTRYRLDAYESPSVCTKYVSRAILS